MNSTCSSASVLFADFRTITRSKALGEPTDITQELLAAGVELLTMKLPAGHLPVRLLGFGAQDLGGADDVQGSLFSTPNQLQREIEIATEIEETQGLSRAERLALWEQRTISAKHPKGLSRPTYYRRLKEGRAALV